MTGRKTDIPTERQKDRRTDRKKNRQKERQTDQRTNRKKDRHINRELREITERESLPPCMQSQKTKWAKSKSLIFVIPFN